MIIKINLTTEHIQKLNGWLKEYSNPELEANYTGVYAGIKWSLTKMNLLSSVYRKQETEVEVEQDIIDSLIKKMKLNQIKALYNIGFASGIYWTLDTLNISKEIKNRNEDDQHESTSA